MVITVCLIFKEIIHQLKKDGVIFFLLNVNDSHYETLGFEIESDTKKTQN